VPVEAFDIEDLKKQIPELPAEKRKKYEELGIGKIEADILVSDINLAIIWNLYSVGAQILRPKR